MWSARDAGGLLVRAPAKVNLFLEVLGKRPDGYHELATLMVAVSLFDTLEFKEERSKAIRLEIVSRPAAAPSPLPSPPGGEGKGEGEDRPELSAGPDNLILRAAELLRQRSGHAGGARVRLQKRIPLAAGLAGGSTDAATTLFGLNRLWRLGLDSAELARLAAELGSDVPFFFHTPAAWCTGRGEIVTPIRLGRPLWMVLVCPPAGLPTATVFRNLTVPERPEDGSALRACVAEGDVERIGRRLHNRLQPAAERLCPLIADLDALLGQVEPAGHRMSGSGTTLFALCRGHRDAARVAARLAPLLREAGASRAYVVRSCV